MDHPRQPSLPAAPVPNVRTPSLAAAILGALLVLGAPVGGAGALALLGGDAEAFLESLRDAGLWALVVLGVAGFAALVSAVLVFLAARGKRVPVAIGLFLAVLPWVAGLAGTRTGAAFAAAAVGNADASSRAMLLARGISEATTARLFGATMTAALLGSLAIAWAMASLGQRAENRRGWLWLPFGFLGLVGVAVPVVVLASAQLSGLPLLLLSGGAAALALALAAAGAGGDAPHGRAAALSGGAVLAALLGGFAAVEAIATRGIVEVFSSIAGTDPADTLRVIVAGSMEVVAAERAMLLGGLALLFAAACVLGWSLSRARPSAGRIVGAVLAGAVVALAIAGDHFTMRSVADDLDRVAQPAWASVPGFEPARVGSDAAGPLQAIVTVDRLQVVSTGESVQLASQLDPRAQPALAGVLRNLPGDPWLAPGDARALTVAVDRRVGAPALRTLVAAARDVGLGSIVLVGLPATPPVPEATGEQLRAGVPFLAWALRDTGGVRIDLDAPLAPGDAADPAVPPQAPLTLADGDTAQSLITGADRLTAAGRRPVLVSGALPPTGAEAVAPAAGQVVGQLLPRGRSRD